MIPILARTLLPASLGENAVDTARILLPLTISASIICPVSGFIVSKIRSIRSLMLGSVIMSVSFMGSQALI